MKKKKPTIDEVLEPIQKGFQEGGLKPEEAEKLLDDELKEMRKENREVAPHVVEDKK